MSKYEPKPYVCPLCGKKIIGCAGIVCYDCTWLNESGERREHCSSKYTDWVINCDCRSHDKIVYLLAKMFELQLELNFTLEKLNGKNTK